MTTDESSHEIKKAMIHLSPPTATITVVVSKGQQHVAKSQAEGIDGNWTVKLPPQKAGSGYTVVISDETSEKRLVDVAFGDVFMCEPYLNTPCRNEFQCQFCQLKSIAFGMCKCWALLWQLHGAVKHGQGLLC